MSKKMELIYDFFEILKDAILYILAVYIIEVLCGLSFFRNLGILSYLIFIPIKAFLYSGIYGALAEVISGEELRFTYEKFVDNSKEFWKLYFLISLVLSVVSYAVKSVNPNLYFLKLISINIDSATMVIMAWLIIRKKYANLIKGSNKVRIIQGQVSFLLIACLLNGIIFFLQVFFADIFLDNNRILLFLSKYIHFGVFLCLNYVILKQIPSIEDHYSSISNIFLINPVNEGVFSSAVYFFSDFKLSTFTIFKALTGEKYKVRIFNKVIWKRRYYKNNILVGVSCSTPNCYEAYKIAKEFKKRGVPVVMGGHHVSYMPEEALEFCDSVVIGFAEELWKDIVKDYENKSLKRIYHKPNQNVFTKEIHDRIMTFSDKEIRDSLELFRGCKYRCDFCSLHAFGNAGIQRAPIEFLIERIKKIRHKYNKLIFMDSNIYCDIEYAKDFFRALKPLKVKWSAFCSVDIAEDQEALRLARESGCVSLDFGFETFAGSEETKKGGKFKYGDKYVEYAKSVKKSGINVAANFILGFDSDGLFDILRLFKFCYKIWPRISFIALLIPFPGTQMHANMVRQDRLNNLNWKQYVGNKRIVFDHKKLRSAVINKIFFFLMVLFVLTTSLSGIVILIISGNIIYKIIKAFLLI